MYSSEPPHARSSRWLVPSARGLRRMSADVLLGVVRVLVMKVLTMGLLVGEVILMKDPLVWGVLVVTSLKCSAVDDATSSEVVLDLVKELCL